MKFKDRFTIVEFTNPSGKKVYRVTGRKPDGTRVRANFKSKSEANTEKARLEMESENIAVSRVPKITGLTDAQLDDAEAAFRIVGDEASLVKAARYFVENYREPIQNISMKEAFDLFIADKKAANARPLTIQNLEVRVGGFVNKNKRKTVAAIDAERIRRHIHKPGLTPTTKDNTRRALSSFFTWAEKRGYCKPSPMREIEPIRIERDEPEVLSLAACKQLLAAATSYSDGILVPYVTLGLFAAIRPNEIAGLTWDNIDLDEKLITITSATAKMRQRRIVEIADNLVEWLRPHAEKESPIVPPKFRREIDTVKALAGYSFTKARVKTDVIEKAFPDLDWGNLPKCPDWIPDVLRHTAISYHLAEHQHEGKTATWAGNSPDIIQKHYKGLVKPKDATKFWQLSPATFLRASSAA